MCFINAVLPSLRLEGARATNRRCVGAESGFIENVIFRAIEGDRTVVRQWTVSRRWNFKSWILICYVPLLSRFSRWFRASEIRTYEGRQRRRNLLPESWIGLFLVNFCIRNRVWHNWPSVYYWLKSVHNFGYGHISFILAAIFVWSLLVASDCESG